MQSDPGLDFGDQQHSIPRMQCEDVDAPAVAEVVEADLRSNEPAETFERRCDPFLQSRVSCVEQPIELLALPSHVHLERCAECCRDPVQIADCHVHDRPALGPSHLAAR
jgi:hypothetical protein